MDVLPEILPFLFVPLTVYTVLYSGSHLFSHLISLHNHSSDLPQSVESRVHLRRSYRLRVVRANLRAHESRESGPAVHCSLCKRILLLHLSGSDTLDSSQAHCTLSRHVGYIDFMLCSILLLILQLERGYIPIFSIHYITFSFVEAIRDNRIPLFYYLSTLVTPVVLKLNS